MRSLVVVVVVLLAAACSAQDPPGCGPYKGLTDHTMCKYKPGTCTAGAEILRMGGLTAKEMKEVVDTHNMLRKQLVDGQVKGQPKAEKMREIVWDTALADVAQRLADQCIFEHDKMRDLPGATPDAPLGVGQNIYKGGTSYADRNTNLAPNMTDATLAWWNEVYTPGFDPKNIKPFVFDSGNGHYTQNAWADTFKIGCGYSYSCKSATEEFCDKIIVCNYFPGGNMADAEMYVAITTTAAPAA